MSGGGTHSFFEFMTVYLMSWSCPGQFEYGKFLKNNAFTAAVNFLKLAPNSLSPLYAPSKRVDNIKLGRLKESLRSSFTKQWIAVKGSLLIIVWMIMMIWEYIGCPSSKKYV